MRPDSGSCLHHLPRPPVLPLSKLPSQPIGDGFCKLQGHLSSLLCLKSLFGLARLHRHLLDQALLPQSYSNNSPSTHTTDAPDAPGMYQPSPVPVPGYFPPSHPPPCGLALCVLRRHSAGLLASPVLYCSPRHPCVGPAAGCPFCFTAALSRGLSVP